jgi:hypothetical protein
MEKQNAQKDLLQAIIEVIVFFDIFDFPLTAFEVRKYLKIKCNLGDVVEVLDNGELQNIIGQQNGFYFLTGREALVTTRMKRYGYGFKKFKRALLVTRFFLFIPWIKLIAVGNVIGDNNFKKDSDIDLFIVTQTGRIWLVRLLTVLFAEIFRLRPSKNKVKDKICLSFFVSEDNLNLESIILDHDHYFKYWLADLVPVFVRDDMYNKLIDSNHWFLNQLPNWEKYKSQKRQVKDFMPRIGSKIMDILFGWLERPAVLLQLKFLPADLRALMNRDSRVIVNDKMLKFHKNDRREEYNKTFRERMRKF